MKKQKKQHKKNLKMMMCDKEMQLVWKNTLDNRRNRSHGQDIQSKDEISPILR